jgi:glycosyltransferase involved in cell wall biosynthesis
MFISLAIPFYNNSKYIKDALGLVVTKDPRINEIIILDDCSNENEYIKMVEIAFTRPNRDKIKIFRNKKNLKLPLNKIEVLKYCNNKWVYLLDADNYLCVNTIDTLYKLPEWNEDTIYAPWISITFPNYSKELDYRLLKNQVIDRNYVRNKFNDVKIKTFMNNCNYFLCKDRYLDCMNKNKHNIVNLINNFGVNLLMPFDSVTLLVLWLKENNKIKVVEYLEYKHRIHDESTFKISDKRFERNIYNYLLKLC